MATTIQSSTLFPHQLNSHSRYGRIRVNAMISAPEKRMNPISIKLPTRSFINELSTINGSSPNHKIPIQKSSSESESESDPIAIAKFYAIMEAVADRVEMHKNIGEQRDNWNRLLLTSVNAMALTAATMTGLAAAVSATGESVLALKISSTLLYTGVTGILAMLNKIQPSQLAEEQRNASRLFKQLHFQLQTKVSLEKIDMKDVDEAMEKVLALDKAYPLPLLGAMIEKFPSLVEPAVWWPTQIQRRKQGKTKSEGNGWNLKMEEEMREIADVLKTKDVEEYLKLGQKALNLNKLLAKSGPVLTALGAFGSAFVGTSHNSTAVMVGIIAGAAAAVVNSVEHGGQVGMVFEMYRSNAGFFKLLQESIESNINEVDVERRENGEVLETKLALQLGRSLSEMKKLRSSEFGSKLF